MVQSGPEPAPAPLPPPLLLLLRTSSAGRSYAPLKRLDPLDLVPVSFQSQRESSLLKKTGATASVELKVYQLADLPFLSPGGCIRVVELMRIMFNINPLENLKAHISSRPPLVVFMVSVSAMAIAFLTLGYFFKIKEIKSPEMAEDWNTFLLRFNDLDLCVSENETLKHLLNDTATSETAVTSGQARSATQAPQALDDSGPTNISVAITLTLDPLKPFGGYSRNVTHLYSTILGHQIGLSGREAHEEINITFTLPAAWNSEDCVLHGHCEQVVFTSCMTVTAATSVFPVTVQPPHCIPETYSNATLWYKVFTTARDANTKYAQDYNPFWCYKGAIGKVYHTLNPKLTVIVPDDDRSLINLHLMHTSYFLFVMVITMFCYAVIKGRPSKLRQNNSEFCPEKVALAEA